MVHVEQLLREAGIEPREARLLLQHAGGLSTAVIAAFPERMVAEDAADLFRAHAARRRAGEPIAYILGAREFYGRRFRVTPDELIPRPETDLLVELALARLRHAPAPAQPGHAAGPAPSAHAPRPARVLDLGTGSGVVAVTLACEAPDALLTAVDAAAPALALARANAADLAPGCAIDFVQGDWFAALGSAPDQVRYDLIVGNPPYVADGDAHLSQGDLRYEPRAALAAGPEGLDAIASIAAAAPRHLQSGAWLLLEHGYDQGAPCRRLLVDAGLRDVVTWRDLAGLERISGGMAA